MNNVTSMLLGAALVAIGVIASAIADRIRGLKAPARERRSSSPPASSKTYTGADIRRTPAGEMTATDRLRWDVVLTLKTAGYSKAEAEAATDECAGSERATLESWTRAAFRKLKVAA